MTTIKLTALVTEGEALALSAATDLLTEVLAAERSAFECVTVADWDVLVQVPAGSVQLISLAHELVMLDVPWQTAEADLKSRVSALAESGDPVFVMTVFRCVHPSEDPKGQLLARIRRLNLFAAELSRELGVFVVDLDRVLTDVGGVTLESDYQLRSRASANLAGHTIALCLAANALDQFISFEAQERTVTWLNGRDETARPEAVLTPGNLISMGNGRRRQRVTTNTDAVQEDHVRWLVDQVFRRKISLADATERLFKAVRRRGAKDSFNLLAAGMVRFIGRKGAA